MFTKNRLFYLAEIQTGRLVSIKVYNIHEAGTKFDFEERELTVRRGEETVEYENK